MDVNKSIPVLFQNLKQYSSEENDIRFQKVKIWLMHLEDNFNGSYFSKQVVEDALPTLSNTPILAYIELNKEGQPDFSDHREVLARKDGKVTTKYLGKAIGTIPETNNAQFEERLCDDGRTRTFLTVEGLLWTKFDDSIDIMNRDSVKGQSMELAEDIEGDFGDDNLFHFTKFKFFGSCGLGTSVQPGMSNSTIELQFSNDDFKDEINLKIEQFKKYFSSSDVEESISNIIKKEDEVVKKSDIATKFSLTVNQLCDEMTRALGEITYETTSWYGEEVEVSRFYLRDFDDQFAYAVDRQNDYVDVKVAYTMNGDTVSFDVESVKRIKYVPTDWEGETPEEDNEDGMTGTNFSLKLIEEFKEVTSKFASEKQELDKQVTEKEDALLAINNQFTSVQSQLSEKEKEIESLITFKNEMEGKERKEKVDALFNSYSEHLTKEDIEDFRSKETTFAKVDDFEKEIKSFVCDKVIKNVKKENVAFSKMGIPPQEEENISESNNVFDRLANKNKKN